MSFSPPGLSSVRLAGSLWPGSPPCVPPAPGAQAWPRDVWMFSVSVLIVPVRLLSLKTTCSRVFIESGQNIIFLSQKGEFHKLADAKIFLSDCLACDSCVTAEEGVQVSQQNAKDFFRVLNLNKVGHPRCSLVPWPGEDW